MIEKYILLSKMLPCKRQILFKTEILPKWINFPQIYEKKVAYIKWYSVQEVNILLVLVGDGIIKWNNRILRLFE